MSEEGGHGGHNHGVGGMMMEIMCMYFYQSTKVHFIWESFDATTGSAYFGALCGALFIGICCEAFGVLQNSIEQKASANVS